MYCRIIVVASLSLFFSSLAQAGVLETYMAERSRILSLPYADRYPALLDSETYDTNTLLGRYFYNTVYVNTSQYENLYTFTEAELNTLKQDYPQIYYESRVYTIWFGNKEPQQAIGELEEIKLLAQQQNWPRIERWATSALVEVQIGAGLYYSAIINMQSVVSHAPHMEKTETVYDYPLVVIYLDMANALYRAGDYVKSYVYCQKYGDYLPDDLYTNLEARLCKARAEFKLNHADNALVLVAQVMNESRDNNLVSMLINTYTFAARIHRDEGRLDLAQSYAEEGLNYALAVDYKIPGDYFYFYYLLSSIQASRGNLSQAQDYYQKMLDARGPLEHDLHSEDMIMEVKLQIEELKGDDKALIALYKKMLENKESMQNQQLAWKEFSSITDRLDEKQLSFLRIKSQLDRTRSNNMTLLAIITSAFALMGLGLVCLLWQQKRKIESFSKIDQLTSVPNRWHAMERIQRKLQQMHRKGDIFCVALIDLDHFKDINDQYGHDVGDDALIHLAKLFKYQIRANDLFGRYGGEEFILMFDDISLVAAERKLNELRGLLDRSPLMKASTTLPLRFSAGLVEVKDKASLTDVIALCDTLLYQAKSRGRNRTECGRYCEAKKSA